MTPIAPETMRTADPRCAMATMFSVMPNVSVPLGIKTPGRPNIADTLWLTVSDQRNKVYYCQARPASSILWVNLNQLDLSEGSGSRRVQPDGNPELAGDQTAHFRPAERFDFLSTDKSH